MVVDEPDRYELQASSELRRRRFGAGDRVDLAVHRRIMPPVQWRSKNPDAIDSDYLYDLIAGSADLGPAKRVYDAGCGFGAGLLRIHRLTGASGLGVTTSPTQCQEACQQALALGVTDQCTFVVGSYDDHRSELYDLVFAVESLFHSANIRRTIGGLAGSLAPHGRLVIIDDMAVGPASWSRREWTEVQNGWGVRSVLDIATIEAACVESGLLLVAVEDLSPLVKLVNRPLATAARPLLRAIAYVTPRRWQVGPRFRLAQLHLQVAHHRGWLRYVKIVATRPTA